MRTLLIASLALTAGCLTDAAPPDPDDDRAADLARKRCRGAFDCNDGNACTTDACVGGACVFTAVTAPTACDDANPCTWDDACVGTACVGVATLPLLSGDATPAGEGWTGYLETAATTSDGQVITVDTAASPSTQSVSSWGHPLAASWFATHDLEWRARVITATSNPYDGSAVVFPAFSGWYGVGVEREQMVMLELAHLPAGVPGHRRPGALRRRRARAHARELHRWRRDRVRRPDQRRRLRRRVPGRRDAAGAGAELPGRYAAAAAAVTGRAVRGGTVAT